jgi:putative sugar O-methyltransferase
MTVREPDSLTRNVIADITAMREIVGSLSDNAVYGPSRFWETLSEKHGHLIEQFGFANFKRTINFEYSQWGVDSLTDDKIRKLLTTLLRRGRVPLSLLSLHVNRERWTDVHWPDVIAMDTGVAIGSQEQRKIQWRQRAYSVYVGLLWLYVSTEDTLGILRSHKEPSLGNPIPITLKGRTITQDLAMSALELNRVARYVDFSRIQRVAEIGAGYGRLAEVLLSHAPHLNYNIFDIPPALAVSQHYLSGILGNASVNPGWRTDIAEPATGHSVNSFLAHQLEGMPDSHFDLVINVSSFDEMSSAQVEHYFSVIERKCRGWLYIKGHSHRRKGDRLGLQDFPYRPQWKLLFAARDPFVETFEDRVYQLST